MAQFDSIIIFPLLWSLLVTLVLHYNILLEMIIPNFFGAKKFRTKKLDSSLLGSNLMINLSNSYNYLSI